MSHADLEPEPRSVAGWTIEEEIGGGKSAKVYLAERHGQRCALKIYDKAIIERFGRDEQLERIARQRSLIGSSHPNLVDILDGGECPDTGALYLAMTYYDAPTLTALVPAFDPARIWALIGDLAGAARCLEEEYDLVHRDIKPDNIVVLPGSFRPILLDVGVVRPMSADSDLTGPSFVGTLQYSSPEFLVGEVDNSPDGWRALTFYQLGAILHDLIMRRPIFRDFSEPFARLVMAIHQETPRIVAPDVDRNLVVLATNCLFKDWRNRLEFVDWDSFIAPVQSGATSAARAQLAARLAQVEEHNVDQREGATELFATETACFEVNRILRSICATHLLPRFTLGQGESPDRIILAFEPPAAVGRTGAVTVHVKVRVVISEPLAVELSASQPGSSEVRVYSGAFDSAVVREKLEEYIYTAVADGQSEASA